MSIERGFLYFEPFIDFASHVLCELPPDCHLVSPVVITEQKALEVADKLDSFLIKNQKSLIIM